MSQRMRIALGITQSAEDRVRSILEYRTRIDGVDAAELARSYGLGVAVVERLLEAERVRRAAEPQL